MDQGAQYGPRHNPLYLPPETPPAVLSGLSAQPHRRQRQVPHQSNPSTLCRSSVHHNTITGHWPLQRFRNRTTVIGGSAFYLGEILRPRLADGNRRAVPKPQAFLITCLGPAFRSGQAVLIRRQGWRRPCRAGLPARPVRFQHVPIVAGIPALRRRAARPATRVIHVSCGRSCIT